MVKIRKHEVIKDCGSFEVYFEDGRSSKYFYWEDDPGRRLRREDMTRDHALEAARVFARYERDKASGV